MTQTVSLIERLHQRIELSSLNNEGGKLSDDGREKKALDVAYGLFLLRLKDTAFVKRLETLKDVSNQDTQAQGFVSALAGAQTADAHDGAHESGALQALTTNLATRFDMPVAKVTTLLSAALPQAYQAVKDMAGVTPVADFVKAEGGDVAAALPEWALALLPVGALTAVDVTGAGVDIHDNAAAAVDTKVFPMPVSVAAPPPVQKNSHFLKSLLPIVGALILALLAWLLLKSCQQNPTPVATPSAPSADEIARANATPASLSLALDGAGSALVSCAGTVGTPQFAEQLTASIAGVFSAAPCQLESVAGVAAAMPSAQYLPQILGFMKGVPDASVRIVDKTIHLNASNADALNQLIDTVRVALPEDFVVAAEPALDANALTNDALNAAQSAMDALGDAPSLTELTKALNLQIINFAVNSTEIPTANQAILNKAAVYLAAMPDAHLQIVGHTDNTASAAYNQKLSESRAAAVRDYLVAQGVPSERLTVVGMGLTQPVASNATEQGRFFNRRIAFVAVAPAKTDTPETATPDTTHQESAVSVATKEAASSVVSDAKEVLDAAKDALDNK